jgi:hypothetical protein
VQLVGPLSPLLPSHLKLSRFHQAKVTPPPSIPFLLVGLLSGRRRGRWR